MHFLDLPVEIRINIYRHLFLHAHIIHMFHLLPGQRPEPGLHSQVLRTCRKIAAEATPILYGTQCFSSMHNLLPISEVPLYIGRQNLAHISRLRIHTREIIALSCTLHDEEQRNLYQGLQLLEMLCRFKLTFTNLTEPRTLWGNDVARFLELRQAALDILRGCQRLNDVGEQVYQDSGHGVELMWRFVEDESCLREGETKLSLESLSKPVALGRSLKVSEKGL